VPAGEDTAEIERRLADVDALRRRVLNVIPHALRTPITTFRGLAEALPNASVDEVEHEIGPALRRLAAQAEHLLDDMLIAAGYTTALPTTPITDTPVASTVRDVWATFAPLAGAKVEDLVVEVPDDLVAALPTGSLSKILVHVLDNAAKYGEQPTTVRASSAADGAVRIDVESPGPAVPDLPMVSEPFYRGERAVTRSAGLGVGLTVARALVEQVHGSLEVAPLADGTGVLTTVTVPARRPPGAPRG
jgi:signal transduction histidine kinase